MKLLLAVIVALFSLPALALCDLTFTTTGTFDGGPQKISDTLKYEGLDADGVVLTMNKGTTILDVAYKEREKAKKGEGHTVTFKVDRVCDGKAADPEIQTVNGLTWQGISKVIRQSAKALNDVAKAGDDHVAKGNKTGWGK